MKASQSTEHRERLAAVEELIAEVGRVADPKVEALTKALLRGVLELHALGLSRVLELVGEAKAGGASLVELLGADELVGSLLVLHGLHPVALEARVRAVLEDVPAGWRMAEVTARDTTVRVGFVRAAGGSPGQTAERLRATIADRIARVAPEVEVLEFSGDLEETAANFIPAERLLRSSVGDGR